MKILLLVVLIGLALPAGAVRATASATIVAAVDVADVATLRASPVVAVSVSTVSAAPFTYVVVAFN